MIHLTRRVPYFLLFTLATWADPSAPRDLPLRISTETAPPGGMAQVKVFLGRPQAIVQGSLRLDFDPAVFSDVASATVFSAAGDAVGVASVKGLHLDLQFSSESGGIGRLPELPLAVIAVPVLAEAPAGAKATITAAPGENPQNAWRDSDQVEYTISVKPGEFTVGGKLSVSGVRPGGGLLPAGTLIRIDGTGFTPSTEVVIEDVSLASVQFVTQELIDVTLAASAELTGKRLRVRNPDGAEVIHYSWLRSEPSEGAIPIFPLRTYTGAGVTPRGSRVQRGFAIQNQNLGPLEVTLTHLETFNQVVVSREKITIGSGECRIFMPTDSPYFHRWIMTAPDPVRVIEFYRYYPQVPPSGSPAQADTVPPAAVEADTLPYLAWQIGAPPLAPQVLHVRAVWADKAEFSVSTSAPWLTVGVAKATAPADLTVRINPAGLKPGDYEATITLTPDSGAEPYVTRVTLQVIALAANPAWVTIQVNRGDPPPAPVTVQATSASGPAQFSVAVTTEKGGKWLSVSPARGTTPAALRVSVNPKGLDYGFYTGYVKISGPVDTGTVSVTLEIPYPPNYGIGINAQPQVYSMREGAPPPPALVVAVYPDGVDFELETKTASGGEWLHAVSIIDGQARRLSISIDPRGLKAGDYQGTVTVKRGEARFDLPVRLLIWSVEPHITTALPDYRCDSWSLYCSGNVAVSSTPIPVEFSAQTDQTWLGVSPSAGITPAQVHVSASPPGLLPGVYRGKVTVQGPADKFEFPVTMIVPNSPSMRPVIAAVLNWASQSPGPVAAGEAISIFGFNLGSAPSADNSTRVLVDGVAAEVLYRSQSQVSAVVPPQAAGKRDAVIEVEYHGARSGEVGLPVALAAPGLFTQDGSGVGPAAVLNQDNSLNTPASPAQRGTVVQIFATGTSGATAVTIGGASAQVLYSGAAPTFIGLDQINAVVPPKAATGPAVPVTIAAGGRRSQENASIAVE